MLTISAISSVCVFLKSKILKQLCKAGILLSKRGSKGGYYLAKDPKIISVATLITAVDGPIAITDCLDEQRGCDLENICIVKAPWQLVSDSIEDALKGLSLADIVHSMVTEGPFAIPQTNETHTL